MGGATSLVEQGKALYSKGDAEGFCSLYSDRAVLRTPDGRFEGRDTILQYNRALIAAMPGGEVTLGRHSDDGDTYLGEWTLRGTNTGPIVAPDGTEIPATGRAVELYGTEVVEVSDGRIVRHDMLWDQLSSLGQLGLLPGGGGGASDRDAATGAGPARGARVDGG